MTMKITIPFGIFQEIVTQAKSEAPRECCGLLGGIEDRVASCYPLTNRASEPEKRYFAAPEDLFHAMRRIRAANESLLVIYHSHPHGPAYPSPTDLEMAFYPEVVYVIIGPTSDPEVRGYLLNGQVVTEVELEVDGEAVETFRREVY